MTQWPEAIPLPFLDFSGSPQSPTLVSPLTSGSISRRERNEASPINLSVSWKLEIAEYDLFEEFVDETIDNGAALFVIPLRFPKNTELTSWVVRLVGGYSAESTDGCWDVSAQLELVRLEATADPAPLEGWTPFYVRPEIGSEDVPFTDSDDFVYYVIES